MTLITLLTTLILSILVSKIGTYFTIAIAKRQQFYEENNFRKIHSEKVSALGGIPIFLALWAVITCMMPIYTNELLAIGVGTLILVVIGLWDDLKNIGVSIRITAQIAAGTLAFFSGFYVDLGHAILNYGSTIFFIVLMINSLNFIDGINGLAGGLGAIAFGTFAYLFYTGGLPQLALLSIAFMGAIIGFLTYNYGKKAAIFMGDNGSTVIGFVMAIFALKSLNGLSGTEMSSVLPVVLSLLAIPVLDLLAVVGLRLTKGQSPFVGDRTHLHHLLTDSGMSHPEACQFIFSWLVSLVAIFQFSLITSPVVAFLLVTGLYATVRIKYTSTATPVVISLAKLDKPAVQRIPTAELARKWSYLSSFLF